MGLSEEQLQPFRGTLAGFTGEKVHVSRSIILKTIFGTRSQEKVVKVKYLVVNSPNSYNIIIDLPTFNHLGAFLSTKYLVMNYPVEKGGIRTIRGNQKVARDCYHANLRLQNKTKKKGKEKPFSANVIDLDPREEYQQERLEPTEELKGILIRPQPYQTTKIGTFLEPDEEKDLVQLLRNFLDLFAWTTSDMPGIDPNIAFHRLSFNPL